MMKKKRALELGFKCPECAEDLHQVGAEYGCLNPKCFNNFHEVAYRVKLGLLPKNRL